MKHYSKLGYFVLLLGGSACAYDAAIDEPDVAIAESAVVGGANVVQGSRPWQALLLRNGSFICGGSLVARDWVLTAKHCTSGVSATSFSVVMGDHTRSVTESTEQRVNVTRKIEHPTEDVTLLKLAGPVTLNAAVQPIALATTGVDAAGQTTSISGWGSTGNGAPSTDVLQQANLPIATNASCDAAPNLYRDLRATELCAGFLNGTSGGCHGDSGGPLALYKDGAWQEVGVVSWGQGTVCGTYTVFGRVSSIADWARTNTSAQIIIASATNTNSTGFGNVKFEVGMGGDNKLYTLLWAQGNNGYRKWYKPSSNAQPFLTWPYAGGSLGVGWPPDRPNMSDSVFHYDVDTDGDQDIFQLRETTAGMWSVYLTTVNGASRFKVATATNTETTGYGNVKMEVGYDQSLGQNYILLWSKERGGYRKWFRIPRTSSPFATWPNLSGSLGVGWPVTRPNMDNSIQYFDVDGDGDLDTFQLIETSSKVWDVFLIRND